NCQPVALQHGRRPRRRRSRRAAFPLIEHRELAYRSDWTARSRIQQLRQKSEKRLLGEAEWFSFFSSAPSRAGVEGCLASCFSSEIADLAGLLAWRRCVQASFPHGVRNDGRNTVGGLRSPALQSRGGDGWRFVVKFHEGRSVFPCTKSAMIVWGRFRPLWVTESREKFPRREKTGFVL